MFGKLPWQQLVDTIDRVLGDALEHITKVAFWINAVELRCAEQRVDDRGSLAAGIRTGKKIVLATKCNRTQ